MIQTLWRYSMTKQFFYAFFAFFAFMIGLSADKQKNLIENPDFSLKNEAGSIKDWKIKGNAVFSVEDGRKCIKIDGTDDSADAEIFVPIKKEWVNSDKISVTLRVSTWMKTDNVQLGDADWKDSRLAMQFLDESNKMAGEWPNVLSVKGTTPWTFYQRDFKIPNNAAKLKLNTTNFGKNGVAYFSDIKVVPVIHSTSVSLADNKKNLIENPDFSLKNKDGSVKDWKIKGNAVFSVEDGRKCIKIDGTDESAEVEIFVPIKKEWMNSEDISVKLRVSTWIKTDNVQLGDAAWKDTRLAMQFLDENDKMAGDWPNVIRTKGTTPWTFHQRDFKIPKNAAKLKLDASNFGKTGVAYFSDIKVMPVILSMSNENLPLPNKFENLWDLSKAWKESSQLREKICLNDLWRFRPLLPKEKADSPEHVKSWGWTKVPDLWHQQKDWETGDPALEIMLPSFLKAKINWSKTTQAWYQRELTLPENWKNKHIFLQLTLVQTKATIFLDNKQIGEVWFPGGDIELTDSVIPGKKQTLSILLTARPMTGEKKIFMDADRVFKENIVLKHRGLPGDVFIYYRPGKNYITDIQMRPSVQNKKISIKTEVVINDDANYSFSVTIKDKDGKVAKEFDSQIFSKNNLNDGAIVISASWENPDLWDLDSPENIYAVTLTLKNENSEIIDQSLPVKFGFREFRIEGKNFILNDRVIHLRFLKVDSAMKRADHESFPICLKTCQRLKENGFNAFIWGNYEFTPGKVGYMDGILNAADQTGVLQSFTLPHIKDFDSKLDDPVLKKRYQELSAWLIKKVQNHPSVVLYAMNHNTSSYGGDENPLKIDGIFQPLENEPRKQCLNAEAIAHSLDPTRPVYHHHSGLLGQMYTINTYLNWAPRQERSDWIDHWEKNGTVPLFFVEWGLPHIASWSSYRGPQFIWMCNAFQSIWDCEFAAPFIGQKAYDMNSNEKNGIKREEAEWATGKPFNFGALMGVLIYGYRNCHGIQASFIRHNWPALRSRGISAILPWDQEQLYQCKTNPPPIQNPDRFKNLKFPGIVPDILNRGSEFLYHYNNTDYQITPTGIAMKRWNKPLVGYIAGTPEHFTASNANFLINENITKQLAVINDCHNNTSVNIHWSVIKNDDQSFVASNNISISSIPGTTTFLPITFAVENTGYFTLNAFFSFPDGTTQYDSIPINIVDNPLIPEISSKIALFDPLRKSSKLLQQLGVPFDLIDADTDTKNYKILIIGKQAITNVNKLPKDFSHPNGKSILILEQSSEALVRRLGFRTQEYALRKVFVRNHLHPILNEINDNLLHDWKGESTLLQPFSTNLPEYEKGAPKYIWCGFENKHVWRCGNTGTVASVLIEKPVIGNWTPLLDGGFDLQYSPLLEYKEKNFNMIFCQLDLSGRTEKDPVAMLLAANIIKYLDTSQKNKQFLKVMTLGEKASELLKKLNIETVDFNPDLPVDEYMLVLSDNASNAKTWTLKGGKTLGIGLNQNNAQILCPNVEIQKKTGWARLITDFSKNTILAGLSNAELHWRTNLTFNAIVNTQHDANEALQSFNNGQIVLCQILPDFFDIKIKPYLRTTQRRAYNLISQLLTNMGAYAHTPLLEKISHPARITFISLANDKWRGKADKNKIGKINKWFAPEFDDSKWEKQVVPGWFEDVSQEVTPDYQGLYWYRLHLNIPDAANNGKISIEFGPIDDESWVWINNQFLGETSKATGPKEFWAVNRKFDINPEYINWNKENVITVLCNDTYLKGGIRGKACYKSGQGAWLDSYYIQVPEKDDDPYRYYRW